MASSAEQLSRLLIAERDAFDGAVGGNLLSRQEIQELYQSRMMMAVTFDSMELPLIHGSFRNQNPIPKEIAYNLYGPNNHVTLLQVPNGTMKVVDGSRCYTVWRDGGSKRELPTFVVMNVIDPSRELTNIQVLQLGTYCNIASRTSKMKTLWEKVHISSALWLALPCITYSTDALGEDWNLFCYDNNRKKKSVITTIAKALYMTSLFDGYARRPFRVIDIEYIEKMTKVIVKTCLRLSVEPELMDAIKLKTTNSPLAATRYFHHQFFRAFYNEWFQDSCLIKQIFLLFVLPSFPLLKNTDLTPDDIIQKAIRSKIRSCIPEVCEQVSSFLHTRVLDTRENNITTGPSQGRETEDLSISSVYEISFDLITALNETEHQSYNNQMDFADGTMVDGAIRIAKDLVSKRNLTISDENLHLIYK